VIGKLDHGQDIKKTYLSLGVVLEFFVCIDIVQFVLFKRIEAEKFIDADFGKF
jgi:hypothetical protein